MRPLNTSQHIALLLAISFASGCQFAKPRFLAQRHPSAATDQSVKNSPVKEELVLSASKNIDEALNSSLSNKVESRDYNLASANAGTYSARTKVTRPKEQGHSSGCSH